MGIFENLFKRRQTERVVYLLKTQVHGMQAAELYNSQPALRSVISFLADNVASLPLKCYVRKPDGSRVRDRDSALAKLLEHPNEDMTGYELIRDSVSSYLLYDDCYWITVPANTESGWIIEHPPSSWVTPKTRDNMHLSRIIVNNPNGGKATFGNDDYIRFSGWSPYGAASSSERVEALKDILCEQIDAWKFRGGIWKNQGRITQWISRPADTPWGDGARDRFVKSWKNNYAGEDGVNTGGTPLLEDGMRLENTTFNAREAQWAEVLKLAREDVCAVYHVNPSHIYHTDSQTYASAKDNARALYSDTMAPILEFFVKRINTFLVPRLGLEQGINYCEFDLSAKLQGSFEEQATVMSSAVGAPWMTRSEARERFNLPRLEGSDADELVTPLNVLIGGQASPQDVDGVEDAYASAAPSTKSAGTKIKSAPDSADAKEIAEALKKFFKRQSRSIEGKLSKGYKADDFPEWWDADRWERELADDLRPIFQKQAVKRGKRASDALDGEFSAEEIEAYIAVMAKGKSKAINNVTFRQLQAALDGDIEDEDAMGATVSGVFEKAEETRADVSGRSFATAVAGFAIMEACRQLGGDRQMMKTWIVTSGNPRPAHAAMDGETVPYDELFSNGANFPGDQVLTPDESCGCQCQVEILIP